MDRVKISELITSINGLCCFAIVLGIFLPFVKVEVWGYDIMKISIFQFITDSDVKELISDFSYSDDVLTTIIVFGIAFSASLIAGSSFKSNISLVPTIIMIIAAIVGKHMIDELTDSVFQFGAAKKLIGSTLLTWGYRVLLWDSIAAFVVNFYLNYVATGTSQLANTLKSIAQNSNNTSGKTIKCTKCGAENNGENKFCNSCGNPLQNDNSTAVQSTWFCSRCGNENSVNSRFCDKCGNSKS